MTRRAALVTGGAKRVGRAIALDLARQGIDILLHYHRSEAEAQALRQEIEALGVSCLTLQADLSQETVLAALIERSFAVMPHCSILINNASTFGRASFLESSAALYHRELMVNLHAPVLLTQAFAKQARQGVVINMCDTQVTKHKHQHFAYLLAKKALASFTLMAAADLAPAIRVNAVCPGFLLPSEGWGEEYQHKLEARLPLREIASLDAVTHAIRSLVDNPAITGQLLFVDGGEHLL